MAGVCVPRCACSGSLRRNFHRSVRGVMGWISPHFANSYIRPPIRSSRPIIKPIPGHLTLRRSWSSGRNIALRCPDDAARQHDDDDIACPLFKLLNVNGTIGNHNPNVAKNNLDLAAVTKQSNRGRLRKAISFRIRVELSSLISLQGPTSNRIISRLV